MITLAAGAAFAATLNCTTGGLCRGTARGPSNYFSTYEVHTVPATGGSPTNLTRRPGFDGRPSWAANVAPEVRPLLPRARTTDRTPLIKALVRDLETNLSREHIVRFYLDGRLEPFSYDRARDVLYRTSSEPLPYGTHTAKG